MSFTYFHCCCVPNTTVLLYIVLRQAAFLREFCCWSLPAAPPPPLNPPLHSLIVIHSATFVFVEVHFVLPRDVDQVGDAFYREFDMAVVRATYNYSSGWLSSDLPRSPSQHAYTPRHACTRAYTHAYVDTHARSQARLRVNIRTCTRARTRATLHNYISEREQYSPSIII